MIEDFDHFDIWLLFDEHGEPITGDNGDILAVLDHPAIQPIGCQPWEGSKVCHSAEKVGATGIDVLRSWPLYIADVSKGVMMTGKVDDGLVAVPRRMLDERPDA